MPTPFMCIGAQKAGTTWLYEVLRQHNEIGLPPIKEVHYFDAVIEPRNAQRLAALSRASQRYYEAAAKRKLDPLSPKAHTLVAARPFYELIDFFSIRSDQDYLSYLERFSRGKHAYGDITPSYALLPEEEFCRIRRLLPDVRIIYIMRDPVARTWSQIKMEASRQASRAAKLAQKRLRTPLEGPDRSDYKTTIERLQRSGIEHCRFFLFEEAFRQPRQFVEQVLEFVGVKSAFSESMRAIIDQQVHKTRDLLPPPEFVSGMRQHYRPVRDFVQGLGFDVEQFWGW
ncbi:MAG: sulfotransferase [Alphaproteobacteria bacterium]|nr:sulfotransferase [Alphaproteobacteria bacterium]